MRMDDATRLAIEHFLEHGGMSTRTLKLVDDFLRQCLTRDAERATPVDAAWLDGAEGKRLDAGKVSQAGATWSFGSDEPSPTWFVKMVRIELYEGHENMVLQDRDGKRVLLPGIPTVAQVRDAVRLFTGRE